MTRQSLAAVAMVMSAVTLAATQESMRTSRATTAGAVQVPVSVRDGTRPVLGLAATDFVLTDNDVAQHVEAVTIESVPLDITLIVDTSGGTTGIADQMVRDVQQIARLLRKDDAFRVIRIDTAVEEARPMGAVTTPVVISAVPRQNGASSVHDALIAALVRPVALDRRHLVVAITDGRDTMSVTTADRVREVASRSEALLQIIMVRPPGGVRGVSFMRPRYSDENILLLTEAAETTGGELRGRGLFGDAEPVAAFKRVFDDVRQSYLLRYSPREVDSAGWHELAVTVPKLPNATVRVRKGYSGG
jgi:VWFA-related protein